MKEVAAAEAKVNAGFSTIERECIELNGSGWRDNLNEQATERDAYHDVNLTFPPERAGAALGAGGKVLPTPPEPPAGGNTPKGAGQPAARLRTNRRRIFDRTLTASGAHMR